MNMKRIIIAISFLTIAVMTMAFSALAEKVCILDIFPEYDIAEKYTVNSSDKSTHIAPIMLGKQDAYALVYSYKRKYYKTGEPLTVKPAESISINTGELESLTVEFSAYYIKGDTPFDADGMALYATWNGAEHRIPVSVTEDADTDFRYDAGVTRCTLYKITSDDICAPADGSTVSNIRFVPCTDIKAAAGAFRLVSMSVYGDDGKETIIPSLTGYSNTTSEPVASENGKYTYTFYKTDFDILDGWTTNTTVSGIYKATVNGKEESYAGFVLGANRIIEATYRYKYNPGSVTYSVTNLECIPLKLISPELSIDTSAYETVPVEFRFWRNTKTDPAPEFKLYFSSSGGKRFTSRTVDINISETGETVTSGKNTYKVYRAVFDLKKLALDVRVTNVMLMPYSNIKNGKSEFFRILDFKITGTTDKALSAPELTTYDVNYDSAVLQKLIDDAAAAGKHEVTIPKINPRTGADEWLIAKALILPQNMTVYINDCTLRRDIYAYCNIFTTAGSYKTGISTDDEETGISIIGLGNAVLSADCNNGHNKFTRTGRSGSLPSSYTNHFIFFRNVRNFTVKNITCYEPTFWATCFVMCREGTLDNLRFVSTNQVVNQDGIDLRFGCNNIDISNIYGSTGDDTVALTTLPGSGKNSFFVTGKDVDIHDVTIKNVFSRTFGGCFNVRLLAHDGAKIYNVDIDNVTDTASDFTGGNARAAVVIGHPEYFTKKCMQKGDITAITINNVTSCGSVGAVWAFHENVRPSDFKSGNITSLRKGVPAVSYRLEA